MKVRRIGIIGYDGVQALDVTGPADVFASANTLLRREPAPYEVRLFALRKGPILTEAGISLYADATLAQSGLLDTIIIPGGCGARLKPKVRAALSKWLQQHGTQARRIVSVCTGLYVLAESGLIDGRVATTHWRFASDVQERWKNIRIDADAIFLKDGKYYTSAGITTGIDLALALVEEDFGNEIALAVARELVVYLKRSGGQLQYSQPLLHQTQARGRFDDIASWIRGHLDEDLTVERLAEHAGLSPRHFNRKFKATFGITPADLVEEIRLDEARWLLLNTEAEIQNLAKDVGYRSDDSFRRAFERRFGVNPAEYRKRFGAESA